MNGQDKRRIVAAVKGNVKEHRRLEFKQRIELSTLNGKAEFVRDVLALANSEDEIPREPGHLVLGAKNGQVWDVTTESYDGATFRDIIRALIAPDLQVEYEELTVERVKRFGVLKIRPDPEQLYFVKKDLASQDGKKLLVAGQAWGRLGDQKVKLLGDDIIARIERIKASSSNRAMGPLLRRIAEQEDLLKSSGPAAEVRRIRYAIELETNWLGIPDELAKVIPYARDFGVGVGFEIARIMEDLAGRISAGTPLSAIQSFTGVFRAILPFSSDEAFRPRPKPIAEDARRLVRQVVNIESSIRRDGITRLHNPAIVSMCSTVTHECLRFAHTNREQGLEKGILAVLDSLIAECKRSGIPEINLSGERLQYDRDDGLLNPAEREKLFLRANEAEARHEGGSSGLSNQPLVQKADSSSFASLACRNDKRFGWERDGGRT